MRTKVVVLLIAVVVVGGCLYAASRIRNSDAYRAHAFFAQIHRGMTRAEVIELASHFTDCRTTDLCFGESEPPRIAVTFLGEVVDTVDPPERMGATIRFGTYGVVVLFDVAAGAPNEDRVDAKAISCVGEPGWLEQMLFPPTRDFEGEFESP